MIQLFDTSASSRDKNIVLEVMDSGQFVMGEHIEAFEREAAHHLGLKGSGGLVACASGTDALTMAIEEMGCRGYGVIVPAMTFSATYEAVLRAGAIPIVADVDDQTLTPTVTQIRDAIVRGIGSGVGVKAVIVVHLYGWPAHEILEITDFCLSQNIVLIEDCAQAFGASLDGLVMGSLGDAAAFSFYPTKPLGGISDGGAAYFRREDYSEIARTRRNHGRDHGVQVRPGYNSRLSEISAAVLRDRLLNHKMNMAVRHSIVERYKAHGLKKLAPRLHGDSAPYVFPVLVENREAVRFQLAEIGVETRVHYDPAVNMLPYVDTDCPNAKWVSRRVLSLPCHQKMTSENVDRICDALRTQAQAEG